MTEELKIPEDVAKLVDWIPLKRYLQLYGETKAAVANRTARGLWVRGKHYNVVKGGGTWVSIKAVNEWASSPEAQSSEPSQ